MGDKKRKIQNLEIIKSDLENNLIYVKGSIPGSKNSWVLIQQVSKKINRSTTIENLKKIKTQEIPKAKKETPKKAEKTDIKKTEKIDKKVEKK